MSKPPPEPKRNSFSRFLRVLKPIPHIKRLSQAQGEADFLAGKHSRTYEFFRVMRIAFEFIRGFWAFHFIPPAITIFGSARFPADHPYSKLAEELGARIAKEGFVVVTGGGPGIMEAANRGAQRAGGLSMGANILLPHEQRPNPYLDRFVTFYYFFVRKVILVKYSYAFIVFPGGFGTLDELSEALTLIQTGKLYDFPVILVGSDYWKGFMDWLHAFALKNQTISDQDLKHLRMTDDLDQVMEIIRTNAHKLKLPLKPIVSGA